MAWSLFLNEFCRKHEINMTILKCLIYMSMGAGIPKSF
jgi:hypothetical protein